jgi:hypothetical protein
MRQWKMFGLLWKKSITNGLKYQVRSQAGILIAQNETK